jgi:hypothetical protein
LILARCHRGNTSTARIGVAVKEGTYQNIFHGSEAHELVVVDVICEKLRLAVGLPTAIPARAINLQLKAILGGFG